MLRVRNILGVHRWLHRRTAGQGIAAAQVRTSDLPAQESITAGDLSCAHAGPVPFRLVAATDLDGTSGWAQWLQSRLDERGMKPAALIRASGGKVTSPRLANWLSGKEVPRMSSIRAVCAALGVPAVEGAIAAGHLVPEDVGAVVVDRPPLRSLTKRELLAYRRELDDVLDARIPDDLPADDTSGGHSTVSPIRPVPVIRPEGRRGTDWAARPRPE